ncbi:LacI family transcriptional regulator [Bacillus infantis]|uniref:LacI family DNA-binding transcriptional regulator n=1 Tax=Bacillus infantis TaxID=324767 RepID=UPI001CD1E940|nr:LacI family transcriptional regulator [Bacillus infantis]
MKDVAREAGVSISTVSNALNDVDVIHPATKEHILKVASRLNYIPNLNGKNLKSSDTKVLGLFLTSIKGPYYGTLTDAIYNECEKAGYELNVFLTKDHKNALGNILGKRIDGAIILNEWINDEHITLLENANAPIVFLDREIENKKMASVVFDSFKGGQSVARYLINMGHRNIGYISGYKNNYDNMERFKGFKDTLIEFGIGFSDVNRLDGYFEEEAAYTAVKAFVKTGKKLPDAFFAANDLSAIGCIKALKSEGFSVPEDISVVGFDDIEASQYFNPAITTVSNPIIRQGRAAVEKLLDMIQDKDKGSVEKLEGSLIIRDSCSINKNVFIG